MEEAKKAALWFKDLFKDDYYLEIAWLISPAKQALQHTKFS